MAGDVPQPKKLKLEPVDPISETFYNNADKLALLNRAVEDIRSGYSDEMKMIFRKVNECNARESVSFSDASCSLDCYSRPGYVAAGTFFVPGITILERYCSEDRQIPTDRTLQAALSRLLKYLSDDHGALLYKEHKQDGLKEWKWAVILAQHLLSKLAIHDEYVIESYPRLVSDVCACEEKDAFIGKVGDTSFGCVEGWHGRVDVILEGNNLPVKVGDTIDEGGESTSKAVSSIEIKQKLSEEKEKQVVAPCIVFSFLQRKFNKISFVPGIGIGRRHFKIMYYDSNEDLLISTAEETRLFDDIRADLLTNVKVLLWMTLNYRYLASGVPKDSIHFKIDDVKAEFFKRVDDSIAIYREKVVKPAHSKGQNDRFPVGDALPMSKERSDLSFREF